MRRYAEVLRVPHVAALIAATLLARFPIGINALAVVLDLRAERGSFVVAGAVAGALAAGSGVGAPVQGRLVDAFGQRRVLVAFGFVAGFAIPPTSSILRCIRVECDNPRPSLAGRARNPRPCGSQPGRSWTAPRQPKTGASTTVPAPPLRTL